MTETTCTALARSILGPPAPVSPMELAERQANADALAAWRVPGKRLSVSTSTTIGEGEISIYVRHPGGEFEMTGLQSSLRNAPPEFRVQAQLVTAELLTYENVRVGWLRSIPGQSAIFAFTVLSLQHREAVGIEGAVVAEIEDRRAKGLLLGAGSNG